MAETLGSLCDKLTIVKLKQWHSQEEQRLSSLALQQNQLQNEIDQFMADAVQGRILSHQLTFAANKVFKTEGNVVADVSGSIGEVISQLASVNCELWHQQEKVYEFENVAPEDKDDVVKQLAILNLQRNKCIDQIDRQFQSAVQQLTNGA